MNTRFPASAFTDLAIPKDYRRVLQDSSLKDLNSAEEVIARIFELVGDRGRVTPRSDNGWYRAWFLTGASKQAFALNLPHSEGILYAYGGECKQQICHTHYVCVTDQFYSVADMRQANLAFHVEGVQRTVRACVTYIQSQLVGSPFSLGTFIEWSKEQAHTYPKSYHRPVGSQTHQTVRTHTPLRISNRFPASVDPEDYANCKDIPRGRVVGNSPTVVVSKQYTRQELLELDISRIARENPYMFHLIIPNGINPWK